MEPVIAGHPIHPVMITFPVGLFPASYMLDIAALATDSDTLAEAAYINMLIGAVGSVAAATTGYLDYRQMAQNDPAHSTATTHGLLNASLLGLYGLNLLVRRNNKRSKFGFLLSTVGTAALMVSGYLGGEIAYGRGWRVRNAERFELEWQKEHGVGPFALDGGASGSVEQTYPPATIKGFQEKRSGDAVFKEIQQASPAKSPVTPVAPSRPVGMITQPPGDDHSATQRPDALDKPSQAEGDRDTVDSDLNDKA